MGAIAGIDDLIARLAGENGGAPETVWFSKENMVDGTDGPNSRGVTRSMLSSLWRWEGLNSRSAPDPTGTPAMLSRESLGAVPFTPPAEGKTKYLVAATARSNASGTLYVYDRLSHVGGFDGTSTDVQTVDLDVNRNMGGEGNRIWLEVTTLLGTSSRTATVSYTNQDGVSGRIAYAQIGSTDFRAVGRMLPVSLRGNDTGVRSVESVQLSASTGAGAFAVVIGRAPLVMIGTTAGTVGTVDAIMGLPGIPPVDSNACLALGWRAGSTSTPDGLFGALVFVEA